MQRGLSSACLLVAIGCGTEPNAPPPPTDPQTLAATLEELAAFGPKPVGSDAGHAAGDYLLERLHAIGLAEVHDEPFAFPRHQVDAAALTVTVEGAARAAGFDVFEGSGSGVALADVVYVHSARPEDLAGVDLHGKVALVDRNRGYHRAAQYANVAAAGAVAMLYVSAAAGNLRQVGSVRLDGWSPLGPIPALTLGADDGRALAGALGGGRAVRAFVDVAAHAEPAHGRNLLGRLPARPATAGAPAAGTIVVGAHYDTWFTGSCDNGGGVAALLALAARRHARAQLPRYSLVFVAYDGEEVALYGGYHFLREHIVGAAEPVLAVLNLEMPSARSSTLLGLARSNHAPLVRALDEADLGFDYPFLVGMEVVPALFGGIIPTDIQGIYRSGVPTASTAVDSPWYHTSDDTPDKVDTTMLAQAVDDFDRALELLLAAEPAAFAGRDPALWQADLITRSRDPLVVDIAVRDAAGVPQPGAAVAATLFVDDFFPVAQTALFADDGGLAQVSFAAQLAHSGRGRRFLQATAGIDYPLVENVLALP